MRGSDTPSLPTIFVSTDYSHFFRDESSQCCEHLRANIGSTTYGQYLGADVQFIIDGADAIFIVTENGEFHESKGVRLEYTAAQLYGKKILFN